MHLGQQYQLALQRGTPLTLTHQVTAAAEGPECVVVEGGCAGRPVRLQVLIDCLW
jgi:hypothetical protein